MKTPFPAGATPNSTVGNSTVAKRPRCPAWLLAGLVALASISVYWPAMSHGFVNYDDPLYVTGNVHVRTGLTWRNIRWAFGHTVVGNWQPLTLLSHMLDCQIYGLHPWGHHLTNVLLHGVNTALVFLLLCLLTGVVWRSLTVAALFGLHPLHVESVAWVAERKDVLSTFFGLLCLIAYARYAQSPPSSGLGRDPGKAGGGNSKIYYVLALLMFVCGLMSKPMLVTLPFVLLLLDYWPLNRMRNAECGVRNFASLLVEKIPFFALTAGMSVVTYLAQQQAGMMRSLEHVPLDARAGNALISYCRYLGKLFWPSHLAVFYPYPKSYWPMDLVQLAGGLLTGVSAFVFLQRKQRPYLLTGWLWFCGTLVPVIGLVQVGGQAMADRYAYIPSLGVFILTVWGIYDLAKGWRHHPMVLRGAGCAAMILCAGLTRRQLGYWQNNETLYRHALAVTQNNYLAHHNLGIALFKQGEIDGAIRQYQEALCLKPGEAEAHYNLGAALAVKGRTREAIAQFQKAIHLDPDYAAAHVNLGTALLREERLGEAIGEYRQAVRLQPENAEFHNALGTALGMEGHIDEAIAQLQEAVRLQPDYAAARQNLAHALQIKNAGTGR